MPKISGAKSPRKRSQLVVRVGVSPSRAKSSRIQALNDSRDEDEEQGSAGKKLKNLKKKHTMKPKGKTVQAATSVKQKAKKIAATKKKTLSGATSSGTRYSNSRRDETMSVLAKAAARKRRLDGEDDDEDIPAPPKTTKVKKKAVPAQKKKKAEKKPPRRQLSTAAATIQDIFAQNDPPVLEEEVVEETVDDQPMVAVKQEEEMLDLDQRYAELQEQVMLEQELHDQDDDDEEDLSQQDEDGAHEEMEVSQEQLQAELAAEDDDDQDDDEEDIDENLFFGIPEQHSPELATCTHCKGKFRKEDVHEHMLTCPERYVQCRECGKILSNLQTLERHHKRFHLKIREVPCTLCDKMFIDEAAARKHLKTVHFKVKNFHCPHCDKSFSQRNKLTYHVRTHSGEKPYSCAECGRSFSLLWNLKTHLRTHTGEKPYACETCGRRFTQKQNMTSHLTTHRKPKSDKGYRNHFGTDSLDQYGSANTGMVKSEFSYTSNRSRQYDSLKQIGSQSLGSGHYVLGDMHSIEVRTAEEQERDQNVNLEHGLGLLSSVARKGDAPDSVQVDGIVNLPENQANANLDQVVEVLIKSNGETDKAGNPLATLQFGGNNTKIALDGAGQGEVLGGDGQEISVDGNTAAGLANILQNPEVLAAINAAASTNKFIVIGPVSMFDQSNADPSQIVSLSAADSAIDTTANPTFSEEGLANLQDILPPEQDLSSGISAAQSVNDSISATAALAAVENFLHNQTVPGPSVGGEHVVSSILSSIQADGKRGPSAIVQSAQANLSRASNLTISMPPMSQNTLTISPANLSINPDSTRFMKQNRMASINQSEVSSSIDPSVEIVMQQTQQTQEENHVDSTGQPLEFNLVEGQDISESFMPGSTTEDGDVEPSSSGEPILMLSTDEHGQPQIIVKMPDGSETIMSDPALAESLIQVPTITNADMLAEDQNNMVIDQIAGTIQLQVPDQSIDAAQMPSQSSVDDVDGMQIVTQSHNDLQHQQLQQQQNIDSSMQLPDQSLDSTGQNGLISSVGDCETGIDSTDANIVGSLLHPQSTGIEETDDNSFPVMPDSSSQTYQHSHNIADSNQGMFIMEHIDSTETITDENEASIDTTNFITSNEATSTKPDLVENVEDEYLQLEQVSQSTSLVGSTSSIEPFETDAVSSTATNGD